MSKSHSPVSDSLIEAAFAFTLSSGCRSIHPMPSADQSVFKNTDLSLSYRARTGEEVMFFLHLLNRWMRSGFQSTDGITFSMMKALKLPKWFQIDFKPRG